MRHSCLMGIDRVVSSQRAGCARPNDLDELGSSVPVFNRGGAV